MSALRDLLEEACRKRNMADCEFFINKRDYPQLKFNDTTKRPVEPYGFIYDKDDRDPDQDVPLKRQNYAQYTPILSFYCSDRFADIPFPTSEDWEAATGKVFPRSFFHSHKDGQLVTENPRDLFTEDNFKKFHCEWEDKQDTAFFRGTATGGGTTRETNQRLALAWLSYEWSTSRQHNGANDGTARLLDAAITGWNKRDKKIAGQPMRYLDTTTIPFPGGKENFTPIYEQSKFKYLIYAEGHCAACRYGFMMRMGSVIIKVTSRCVADSMWYFPLLEPWVDHVPVKEDLSDLEEKLRWCRAHDDECRKIADKAGQIYERFVARSACLDYVEMISHEINSRFFVPPSWWTPGAGVLETPPPVMPTLGSICSREGLCTRCKKDRDDEDARRKASEMDTKGSALANQEKKAMIRKRMLKKVKEKSQHDPEKARKVAKTDANAALTENSTSTTHAEEW
ncbi:unnamed protein product [Discosporangium mesarthrocarpum]